MGFLDRMLADLAGNAIGVKPRTMRKLLRGKSGGLLLMGAGAALASALDPARQRQPAAPPPLVTTPPPAPTPQRPMAVPQAVPPPLPPIPSTAVASTAVPTTELPTPPSIPAAPAPAASVDMVADETDEVETELPAELVYGIVRAMVAAALADGALEERERTMIHDHLAASDLSADERQQIHRDLALPPSPTDLADLSENADWRLIMYRSAAFVILADGLVSAIERAWLDRLATAFELDAGRRTELERELFADA